MIGGVVMLALVGGVLAVVIVMRTRDYRTQQERLVQPNKGSTLTLQKTLDIAIMTNIQNTQSS